MKNQPIDTIEWVDPHTLKANGYNPNHVAPVEMELLKTSILETGWTQPIVVNRATREIVDGFHRWTTGKDPKVGKMTGGLVPVVFVDIDPAHQRLATVRHNRARGSHAVLRMADIVRELVDNHGMAFDEVMKRLGMDDEEVERLYDTGGMTKRGSAEGFAKGWIPE